MCNHFCGFNGFLECLLHYMYNKTLSPSFSNSLVFQYLSTMRLSCYCSSPILRLWYSSYTCACILRVLQFSSASPLWGKLSITYTAVVRVYRVECSPETRPTIKIRILIGLDSRLGRMWLYLSNCTPYACIPTPLSKRTHLTPQNNGYTCMHLLSLILHTHTPLPHRAHTVLKVLSTTDNKAV